MMTKLRLYTVNNVVYNMHVHIYPQSINYTHAFTISSSYASMHINTFYD